MKKEDSFIKNNFCSMKFFTLDFKSLDKKRDLQHTLNRSSLDIFWAHTPSVIFVLKVLSFKRFNNNYQISSLRFE
jgi:hypothetical protein